jgi:hypothetical protein
MSQPAQFGCLVADLFHMVQYTGFICSTTMADEVAPDWKVFIKKC